MNVRRFIALSIRTNKGHSQVLVYTYKCIYVHSFFLMHIFETKFAHPNTHKHRQAYTHAHKHIKIERLEGKREMEGDEVKRGRRDNGRGRDHEEKRK